MQMDHFLFELSKYFLTVLPGLWGTRLLFLLLPWGRPAQVSGLLHWQLLQLLWLQLRFLVLWLVFLAFAVSIRGHV